MISASMVAATGTAASHAAVRRLSPVTSKKESASRAACSISSLRAGSRLRSMP